MKLTPAEQLDDAISAVKLHYYHEGNLNALSRFQMIASIKPESITKAQLIARIKNAIIAIKKQHETN